MIMSWAKWTVRIRGHIANERATYDTTKFFRVPAGFPVGDIRCDIARFPEGVDTVS